MKQQTIRRCCHVITNRRVKNFLLLIIFIAFSTGLNAQYNKFELRTGAGYLSDSHIADAVANGVGSVLIFFIPHDFRIVTSGIYSGDALFRLRNPHLQIAATYSFERLEVTEYNNDKTTTFKRKINIIMPGIMYNYILKPTVSLYSGISAGLKFATYSGDTDKTNITQLGYHFTFIGFRYGKKIAGFAELGFGAKGMIRGGIAVGF